MEFKVTLGSKVGKGGREGEREKARKRRKQGRKRKTPPLFFFLEVHVQG